MERNANYALVGLISTILLIAMIVFLFWLANFAFSQRYDTYDVVFHGSVTGLSRGGDVQFNGIKVGEVSDIKLDASDPNIVHAFAKVRSDTPVRVDSSASLEPQGITGVNYIQITAGTTAKPLLKQATPAGQPLVIQAAPGTISSLLSGSGTVMQRAVETLNRINQVLSDQNIQKFTAIMGDVQAVTAELRERKSIFADAQKTLQSAQEAAVQIRDLAKSSQGLVQTDAKQTVVKIGDAATELQATSKALHVMIAKLQDPTADFATTGLPHLTQTMTSLQRTSDDLDRLLNEIQASPRGLIAKPPGKEVEVKP